MPVKNTDKANIRKQLFRIFLRLLFIIPGKGIAAKTPWIRRIYILLYRFILDEVMVEVHGNKMYLRPAASGTERDIFMGKSYEEGTVGLFHKLIRAGMTVVDIGAHIGYYTLIAAKLVGPEGKVFAFEPEPKNFSMLKRNVELNGYKNVNLVNKAVSNKGGFEKFHIDSIDSGFHTLSTDKRSERSKGSISVATTTLDEFFPPDTNIDFIKMDIEGAEEKALQGMQGMLRQGKTKALILEFYPERLKAYGSPPEEIWDRLNAYGFGIYEITGKGAGKINAQQAIEICSKARAINLLCLRK